MIIVIIGTMLNIITIIIIISVMTIFFMELQVFVDGVDNCLQLSDLLLSYPRIFVVLASKMMELSIQRSILML